VEKIFLGWPKKISSHFQSKKIQPSRLLGLTHQDTPRPAPKER
jgi:hypothetical protein